MEFSALLWSIVVPICVASVAWPICRWSISPHVINETTGEQSSVASNSTKTKQRLGRVAIQLLFSCAIASAFIGRHGWSHWTADAWSFSILPVIVVGLLLAIAEPTSEKTSSLRYLLLTWGCCWLAFSTIPTGEGWLDVVSEHRTWTALIVASAFTNALMLDEMSRRGTHRWVIWVGIAGLAAPLAVAAGCYASLAEWITATVVTSIVLALIAGIFNSKLPCVILSPCALIVATSTASGRFYDYQSHPWWSYLLALFVPSIIAAIDWLLRKRTTQLRVIIAGTLSTACLALLLWEFHLRFRGEQW